MNPNTKTFELLNLRTSFTSKDMETRFKNGYEKFPGIYILYIDDICMWVGMSRCDVMKRASRFLRLGMCNFQDSILIQNLIKKSHHVDINVYRCNSVKDTVSIERKLIQNLHPYFNKEYIPLGQRHVIHVRLDTEGMFTVPLDNITH